MKKLILIIACGGLFFACCGKKGCSKKCETTTCKKEQVIDIEHSAKNALDWTGTYAGVLPCADCGGIKTEITINEDGTFEKSEEYLEKGTETIESKGTFTWDKTGGIINLKDEEGTTELYRVGEGRLIMLRADGKEVTGELANNYILPKLEVLK